MNITPQQLEQYRNQIPGLEAEIALHEKELEAWAKRGEAERNLFNWIADVSADPAVKRTPLRSYQDAHKAHFAAKSDLKRLAIERMKSQLFILRAMVAEADKVVKEPGAGRVVLT